VALTVRLESPASDLAEAPKPLRPVPYSVAVTAVLPNILVGLVLFVAPVIVVLFYAFGTLNYDTLTVSWGWTLKPLQQALSEPYLGAVLRAISFAVVTALSCAVLGFGIALVIVQSKGRSRLVLLLFVLLPFWTSFIVRTYAWTNLIGPGGIITRISGLFGHQVVLLGTPAGVLIGMISTYLPMMVLPIYVALDRVPTVLIEAARDLGASEWRILRTVLIPGAAPGLAAGALLVGIPATGEYVVPEILGEGKQLLIGNLISSQMQDNGNYPAGAALTLVLLAVIGLLLLIIGIVRLILQRRLVARGSNA
jgi:ABC-type spermidine/putrescine transport system permease subunit I